MRSRVVLVLIVAGVLVAISAAALRKRHAPAPRTADASPAPQVADRCAMILVPHSGAEKIDAEIAAQQKKIAAAKSKDAAVTELGWLFVSKARRSNDPGFYILAENCARCVERTDAKNADALLLRGHVAHAQHRFAEAEKIAREVTASREYVLDFALLGDALMEQGRLGEAVEAYQKMIDLKPCLETYGRVAHMRWLKGDVDGAIEMMRDAVSAASTRDPEPVAWSYSRLAGFELQKGDTAAALQDAGHALEFLPGYALALLVRGRVQLANGDAAGALESLRAAEKANPLPEYQWTLADAARAAGAAEEAQKIEDNLKKRGPVDDPRTTALFLATRGEQIDLALKLATDELTARQDVFSYDARAWALRAAHRLDEAAAAMEKALAEGTQHGRLFFHAGVIAAERKEQDRAREYFAKAEALKNTLMPSELDELRSIEAKSIHNSGRGVSLSQETQPEKNK